VVSLVDRLIHHSEIIVLEGDSYRMKEAQERADKKKQAIKTKRTPVQKRHKE
jgi:DNA replication protein DnaC